MKTSLVLRQHSLLYWRASIFAFTFLIATNSYSQRKTQVAAVVKEKDIIPEGIAYDEKSKTIFLSSIQKNKILAINAKGEVSDFISSGKDELKQVLGMKVVNGQLWACNNSPEHDTLNREANLHVYDLASRKLLKRITIKDGGKHLFNDFYMTRSGDAYVTDSDGAAIYVVKNGSDKAETFIKGGTIPYPNGITATADEKKIIVSTGGGQGIVSIDLETKEIKSITHPKYFIMGADGLYR
jgi:sugar lactone lactonase YvrE